MADDKRRFIRFPFKMDVKLTVDGITHIIEEIANLGIGGCLLPFKGDLGVGKKCSLKIMLGNSETEPIINVEGEIIREEQGNVAIMFTSIDPESLHHLHGIARYNSPDPERVEQEIKDHPGLF